MTVPSWHFRNPWSLSTDRCFPLIGLGRHADSRIACDGARRGYPRDMRVTQWRVDHSTGVESWLVIEGVGSNSHQTAIREAYRMGLIVDGPAELVLEDDEYGAAMRYPLLRIKGGPGQSPIPRPRVEASPLQAMIPDDAASRT
jgi:hypothetical protein